jgi:hypothetical protein
MYSHQETRKEDMQRLEKKQCRRSEQAFRPHSLGAVFLRLAGFVSGLIVAVRRARG